MNSNLKNAALSFVASLNENGFRGRKVLEAFVDGGDAACDRNNVIFTISFAEEGVPIHDLVDECRKVLGDDCNLEISRSMSTAYIFACR